MVNHKLNDGKKNDLKDSGIIRAGCWINQVK